MFWTLAYWIGLLKLLHLIYQAVVYIYKNKNKESFKVRYGQGWAIVTGATDGIGKEFCRDLAKKGVNIVLISRNEEKLRKVEQELKQLNDKILTRIVAVNFEDSLEDETIFKKIEAQIENLDISMLVNNVGVMAMGMLQTMSQKDIKSVLTVNQIPLVRLLHMIIPMIKKHTTTTNKKGAVVNISSIVAVATPAGTSVYNATKAFTDFFSQAIGVQFRNQNIDFLTARPSGVRTPSAVNFFQPTSSKQFIQKMVWSGAISTQQCINGVWSDLGIVQVGFTSLKHKIQQWFINLYPQLTNKGMSKIYLNKIK